MLLCLSFITLLVIAVTGDAPKELTQTTFDKLIATPGQHTLVMFYAPWCGHCQEAKPKYAKASEELSKKDNTKVLASMNCDDTANSAICTKHKIEGFPTLKLFFEGQFVQDFEDENSEKAFIDFMTNPPKPGEAPKHSHGGGGGGGEAATPDIMMKNVQYLAKGNYTNFLAGQEHVMVFYYAPWCPHCTDSKPKFEKAATELKDSDPTKIFAAMNCEDKDNAQTCTDQKVEGFPTIRYYKKGEQYAEFEDEMETHAFVTFMKNPPKEKVPPTPIEEDKTGQAGQAGQQHDHQHHDHQHHDHQHQHGKEGETHELKDEDRQPEKPEDLMKGITYLTADTFKKTISTSGQHTLVMFYAPWCGHCQEAKPHFQAAAKKVSSKYPNRVFAALNCDSKENEKFCEDEKIQGFPTLIHFANGAKVKEYESRPPKEDDMVAYMSGLKDLTVTKEEL